jgi:hypothetical protein
LRQDGSSLRKQDSISTLEPLKKCMKVETINLGHLFTRFDMSRYT